MSIVRRTTLTTAFLVWASASAIGQQMPTPAPAPTPAAVPAVAVTPAPAPAAPPAYGTPISLEAAKKAMAASEAEAAKNNWPVAIAIIDSTGHLVMFTRLENTQYGSIGIAMDKAQTAVDYRRPTKAFQDLVAQGGGGLRILGIKSVSPLEGGVPIVVDGKIIGAIGVSGVTSEQDAQIARAGSAAVGGK